MPALTPPKLELFCHEYVKGNNASDAYRLAFKPKNAKDKSIWEEASKKLALPKVRSRIEELQEVMVEKLLITSEQLAKEFEEVRAAALKNDEYSPANAAITGKAKLFGLMTDKLDTKLEVKVMPSVKIDGKEVGFDVGG